MKRRQFLTSAGLGLGAAASGVAMPAIAQSNPEIRWRMTSGFPKSLDTLFGVSESFSRRVAEATEGRWQIQPFAAGEIVGTFQAFDAISNGTVEMGHTSAYYYLGKDPTFAAITTSATSTCTASTCMLSRPATPARRWAAGSARR